jgi:hypothetical protein
MKTKNILLGLCFALLCTLAQAQNGLEGIIVEKYYVANAADNAAAEADLSGNGYPTGTLPVGAVTYRIYADLAAGYNLQATYGVTTHALKVTTSTSFYNHSLGSTSPIFNRNSVKNTTGSTLGLDSYWSMGTAASNANGVLKVEDNATYGLNLITNVAGNVLQNNDVTAGSPLYTFDGYHYPAGATYPAAQFTPGMDLSMLLDGSVASGTFLTNDGSIFFTGGVTGPLTNGKVLIGQFTTDGVFGYELNLQLGGPGGSVQNWVANNPTGGELTMPSLTLAPNTPPSVSITSPVSPANVVTGTVVTINATASDVAPGFVTQVEFFDGATSIGVDATSPYSINWTSTVGSHNITARATDNQGATTTSSIVIINAANNQAPTITVSAPANATVSSSVTINATANDIDGTVASVEFFVDNISIGTDNSSPYSINWTAITGVHTIKATATDNLGLSATSSTISITVSANIPPAVSITSPLATATFTAPQVVTINASASDADGTVSQVEFFINGTSIGTDATSPYSINWTSVIGIASITAVATDNLGGTTTSAAIVLDIADPNALPYKVTTTSQNCNLTSFCIPIEAVSTVNDVIGYDITMNYNPAEVTPTGVITKYNDLVNSSLFDVDNLVNNGTIYLSVYFNATAPANSKFSGTGKLICVEFTKNAGFSPSGTSAISIPSLQESYVTGVTPKLVQSGQYISQVNNSFTSTLQFWKDNSPILYNVGNPNQYLITNIKGANASCVLSAAAAVQPDLFGSFTYNISNGLFINIDRDIAATTSVQPVVNGADALLARKLIINDPTFTPNVYQAIAMDVNLDGVISAGDVSQINQRAVLILPEFKQNWNYSVSGIPLGPLSKDWLFVDQTRVNSNPSYAISTTFPLDNGVGFSKYRVPAVPFCLPVPVTNTATCPLFASENFKGVFMGDVNGSYENIGADGLLRNNDRVVFNLSKAVVSGNTIDIPVSILSTENVNALDFSLMFNASKLSYNSIVNNNLNVQSLDYFNTDDNTLRFTSNSLVNYDLTSSIVSVRFNLNNNYIDASDLNSLKAYVNGDEVAVDVLGALSTGLSNTNFNNYVNVYPNPTTDILNVIVSENATVQLLDISGKEVILQTNIAANDNQEINVKNIASGVYLMKIFNNNFVSTKKIVINTK